LAAAVEAAREAAARDGRPEADIEGFLLDLESPRALVDRLPSLGRIDILACSFGPFVRAPLHETSVSDWERLALLDLALPGALSSALVGAMAARGWGRILLFGGTRTDSIRAYSSNAAYAAAKTGLAVLVKSLAAEYAKDGLGAFLLCPGLVDTEYLTAETRAELARKAPRGLLLEASGLAEFAVHLISEEPPIASGAVINLDGGLKL
jgi:NAD(P)-dependent dehydrogenase (short-subunit alcohol dehydrogenase family)